MHLPPSHPSRSSQNTRLGSLRNTAASRWLAVVRTVVYMCAAQQLPAGWLCTHGSVYVRYTAASRWLAVVRTVVYMCAPRQLPAGSVCVCVCVSAAL